MPIFKAAVIDRVRTNTQDKGVTLDPEEIERFVDAAVRRLSVDQNHERVDDVFGDGTKRYAVPANWIVGLSHVVILEFPQGQIPPRELVEGKDEDFYIYKVDDLTEVLQFVTVEPIAGSVITGLGALDVDTITFQSGITVRLAFNGSPALTGVQAGDVITITSATNPSNNGSFVIAEVDDTNDTMDIENPARTDATDDEASDSPAVGSAANTEVIRITYNGRHTLTTSATTMIEEESEALIHLATSFCFAAISARYGQTQDPLNAIDVVDYGQRSRDFSTMAEQHFTAYRTQLGFGEDTEPPFAHAFADIDLLQPWRSDYVMHPREWR